MKDVLSSNVWRASEDNLTEISLILTQCKMPLGESDGFFLFHGLVEILLSPWQSIFANDVHLLKIWEFFLSTGMSYIFIYGVGWSRQHQIWPKSSSN